MPSSRSWPCTSTSPPTSASKTPQLTETLLRLRGWAVWCLNELGDSFAQAIEYGQALVADCERVLGETHPDTLTTRNNLAVAYRDAGRLDEAIPLFERTLADRERVLGDDPPRHPDLPQQPRSRLPGRRAAGRGHPAATSAPSPTASGSSATPTPTP